MSVTSERSVRSSPSSWGGESERSGPGIGCNFMTAYLSNCKGMGLHPVPTIKVTRHNTELDLLVDQIKMDEWKPLLKALYDDQTLHCVTLRSKQTYNSYLEHVDTESKVRSLKRGSSLFTKFTMTCLLETLSRMVTSSKMLACLQLIRLPINEELIALLSKGFAKSKALQHLSIRHAPLGNDGVMQICRAIRNRPNIITMELVDCSISSQGALHIAQLIKFQELERFGESWKHTLRYRDVDHSILPGLRRLTLNSNPNIGNDGLKHITDIVIDDFWIKAIDMQECGITEEGAELVLELVNKNTEIVVFDIRRNSIYNFELMKNIILCLGQNSETDNSGYLWLEIDSLLPRSKSCSTISSSKAANSRKQTANRPSSGKQVTRTQSHNVENTHQPKIVNGVSKRSKTLPPPSLENISKAFLRAKALSEKKGVLPSRLQSSSYVGSSRLKGVGQKTGEGRDGRGDEGSDEKSQGSSESSQEAMKTDVELEKLKNRERIISRLTMLGNSSQPEVPALKVQEFEEVRERYATKPFPIFNPNDLLALVGADALMDKKIPLFGTDRRCPPLRP